MKEKERGAGMQARPRASALAAFLFAGLAGALLWTLAALASGRREAWDASLYWMLAYPLAILAGGLLGYRYPARATALALTLFEAQFLAMALRAGEIGSLWPLGLLLFAILSLPAVAAARVGAGRSPYRYAAGRRA